MPVKIRLMRIGAKKRPFYRVVAVDERKKRTGQYLELLGTYNPLTEPKEIILKQDRIEHWTKQGAVMSHGFLRIMGQAPQKPPRKAKRDKGGSAPKAEPVAEAPADEQAAPQEETATPVEEVAPEAITETAEQGESTEATPTEEATQAEESAPAEEVAPKKEAEAPAEEVKE